MLLDYWTSVSLDFVLSIAQGLASGDDMCLEINRGDCALLLLLDCNVNVMHVIAGGTEP